MLAAAAAPVLSLETLYAIRLSSFSALFTAYPPPIGLAIPLASHALLEPALVRSALADDTADALAVIEAFAHEDGRRAIYEAARALDHAREGFRDCVSSADFACVLVASARCNPADDELLECARIRLARGFPHRTWYQFVLGVDDASAAARAPGDPHQYVPALEAGLTRLLAATDRGPWSRVRAFGSLKKLHFELAHEDRPSAAPVVGSGQLALAATRAVRSHLVSYDAPSRRLFVWSAMPDLVIDLVALIGEALFGDARVFFREPAVDLSVLQAPPAGGLRARGGAFARVSLIGMTWDSGLGHSIAPRGADVYDALARHGIGIAGGAMRHATLRAESAPGVRGPRTADLSIRPPYAVTCSEPEVAPAFLREADKLGLTRPGAATRDWWTLAPYLLAADEWRAADGGSALIDRGLVTFDDRARRVRHPDHPHAGRVAPVFAMRRRGVSYAPPEDPLLGAFLVRDEDLAVGQLDWPALSRIIASELRLSGGEHAMSDDRTVHLGAIDLGPRRTHFVACTEPCAPAALERRARALAPDSVVFVIPEGRALPRGFAQVTLPSLAGPYRPLLAAAVRALGLQGHVPATFYAPDDVRLVLDRAKKLAYLDRTLLVRATEAMVNALLFLADSAGRLVTAAEIGQAISSKSGYDARARKTLGAIDDAIVESFRADKKKPPKERALVAMDRHGQYRLAVSVFVA